MRTSPCVYSRYLQRVRCGETNPKVSQVRKMDADTPTICATSLMRKYPWDASLFVERFRAFRNSVSP